MLIMIKKFFKLGLFISIVVLSLNCGGNNNDKKNNFLEEGGHGTQTCALRGDCDRDGVPSQCDVNDYDSDKQDIIPRSRCDRNPHPDEPAPTQCPSGTALDCDGDGLITACDADDHDAENNNPGAGSVGTTELCDVDRDGFIDALNGRLITCAQKDVNHNGQLDVRESEDQAPGEFDITHRYLCDNCPGSANPEQIGDNLLIGGACRERNACQGLDGDNDSICDDSDNCPTVSNADQANFDGDDEGDVCDRKPHEGTIFVGGTECNLEDEEGDGSFETPYLSIQTALDALEDEENEDVRTIVVLKGYTCNKEKVVVDQEITIKGATCESRVQNTPCKLADVKDITSFEERNLPAIKLDERATVSGSALTITGDATLSGLSIYSARLTADEKATVSIKDASPVIEHCLIEANNETARNASDESTGIHIQSQRNEVHPIIRENKIMIKANNSARTNTGIHVTGTAGNTKKINPQILDNVIEVDSAFQHEYGVIMTRSSYYNDGTRPNIAERNTPWEQTSGYLPLIQGNEISLEPRIEIPENKRNDVFSLGQFGVMASKTGARIHKNKIHVKTNNRLAHDYADGIAVYRSKEQPMDIGTNLVVVEATTVSGSDRSCITSFNSQLNIYANTFVVGGSSDNANQACIKINKDQAADPNYLIRAYSNLFVKEGEGQALVLLRDQNNIPFNKFDFQNNIFDTTFVHLAGTFISGRNPSYWGEFERERQDQKISIQEHLSDYKPVGDNNPIQERGMSFEPQSGPQTDIEGHDRGRTPDAGCYQVSAPE